jgi:hypothetical protein
MEKMITVLGEQIFVHGYDQTPKLTETITDGGQLDSSTQTLTLVTSWCARILNLVALKWCCWTTDFTTN